MDPTPIQKQELVKEIPQSVALTEDHSSIINLARGMHNGSNQIPGDPYYDCRPHRRQSLGLLKLALGIPFNF